MAEERAQHRLVAILAADVVSYSRIMERDEAGTLAALKVRRADILNPLLGRHRGRVFKVSGDGVLIEFNSAVSAVQCAIELQQGMAAANEEVPEDRHIVLRVGVNLGDVMVEGSDLYGDSVNVAARLEGIAEAGGIVISGIAYEQVKNRIDGGFDDLGAQSLKNITEKIRAYCVRPNLRGAVARLALAIPDKPSIAVLPFANMSGEPEQEYFADGMVEEIITALSRFRNLFVIARNSSFTYKGRAVNVKQVGRELGVPYVLEGSVRRVGSQLRIAGQLIDSATGAHLWADRFDGALVVGAIAPRLEQAEIERAKRKPTQDLSAYDYYLRGLAVADRITVADNEEALRLFKKAIERSPGRPS